MKRALPIWLLCLVALAGPAAAQTLDLTRTRIPGGGGASAGGQFGLFSTVGQPEAAPRSAGGAFTLDTGFLGATIPSPVPTVFFPQGTVTVLEDAGPQTRATYAVFDPGQAGEPAQPPTYQLSNDNPALFLAPPAIATNRSLSFTTATNANGSALVTVVVRADGVDVATNTFAIVVTAVNDAPVVSLASNVTVLEDAGAQGLSSFATFTAGPADESAQTPAYTLTTDNAALFSVPPAIAANGTLTFTPATNANGLATVTVVTVDGGGTANGGGDRTTNTFTLTLTAVNDQPSAAHATNHVVVLEDSGARAVSGFTAFTAGPADESTQTPAYTLTADNTSLFSVQPALAANGTLTFTPATNANGSATVSR
ncbi:MAG: Na-Ca exchanger/integrin-beta4 [Limisphaerales bacterium]|nr:MAG: Na-Ca exchanger/integrin-beta4 [Limisphaerales bacterium]KAG0510825.1 MAG: Na-Ca exchanger/integrin-beta4 [Limisphaerales bacterium]